MSLPRYPKYKDSGVEWLGEVPAHWSVDRFKWSTRSCRNGIWGDDAQQNDDDIPCVRVADFDRQKLRVELNEPTLRSVTSKERVGRILSRGDLLLEKSGGGELQPVGCVVLYDDPRPAVCSNFVARMELASGMDPSFWRYLHTAAYAMRINTKSIKQTSGIQNLDQQAYLDESAVFPPGPEQVYIAASLDSETAKIDALVAKQERLIELLKEKRQAVISHAVTKGLNPAAPMKDSAIGWLGAVPAHWEVKPLRRFSCLVQAGPFGSQLHAEEYVTGGIPLVNPTNMVGGLIVPSEDVTVLPEVLARLPHQVLRSGDVVFSRRGELGRCALVTDAEDGWLCGTGSMILRLEESDFNPGYLSLYLSLGVLRQYFESLSVGAVMDSLSSPTLLALSMVVPPVEEQALIVTFVERQRAILDSLTTEAQRAIDLLQERRAALISAAVTGQIDVRPAAERASA